MTEKGSDRRNLFCGTWIIGRYHDQHHIDTPGAKHSSAVMPGTGNVSRHAFDDWLKGYIGERNDVLLYILLAHGICRSVTFLGK